MRWSFTDKIIVKYQWSAALNSQIKIEITKSSLLSIVYWICFYTHKVLWSIYCNPDCKGLGYLVQLKFMRRYQLIFLRNLFQIALSILSRLAIIRHFLNCQSKICCQQYISSTLPFTSRLSPLKIPLNFLVLIPFDFTSFLSNQLSWWRLIFYRNFTRNLEPTDAVI